MIPINPSRDMYLAFKSLRPKRIPNFEYWSCPDAETYLTGVDYYRHPRECRLRLHELYPQLRLGIPEKDDPIKPAPIEPGHIRWGDGESWEWDWGCNFKTNEEALAFSPLENPDFTHIPVVESRNYADEEALYREFRANYPTEWGDAPPFEEYADASFYNTLFMWPLLTFGWERFLEISLEPEFARIINEFAQLNKRVFRAFARLPVHFVVCHDDIVGTRGPFCSPEWMHKHIFPHYEEFWDILHKGGKRVVFMTDGNVDRYADDLVACGADGFCTEAYSNHREIARKHPDCVLAGEGDNRILSSRDPEAIKMMVDQMVETSKYTAGYLMSIGNHIPWNVPPESIKLYLDYSLEKAVRE